MKAFIQKNREILSEITANVFIAGILLLILHHFTSLIVSIWIDISLLSIITFASGFSWFFIFIQKDEEFFKTKTEPYFRNVFLAGLLIITIGILTFDFIENNQLLSSVVSFIASIQFYLVLLTIGSGFFTFYFNRERLEEIEEDIRQEELAEKRRKMEFAGKYPLINQIWGVRWIGKWMYKEGIFYSLLLVFISAYGSFLIFHNLETPEFFHDEWWHVSVITSLQKGGGFELWNYLIDEQIYEYPNTKVFTLTTYYISKVLGDDEWGLRFFTALMGSANIPLIYITFKKIIGKHAALLTSLMFSFNIIAIFLARFLRPYTLFLFCYMIVFYLSYLILEQMIRKEIYKTFITSLLIVFFYSIALDSREFAKILLPIVILFHLFYICNQYRKITNFKKNLNVIIPAGIIFIFLMLAMEFLDIINLSILPQQIGQFISMNKIRNPTIIYYVYLFECPIKGKLLGYILFVLGISLLLIKSLVKKRYDYFYFLLNTLIPLFTTIYLFDRFEDFRYIYYIIPFVYGCMMFGFTCFIDSLIKITTINNTYLKKYLSIIILIIFVIYPIIPGLTISGVTTKAPSEWQDSDGQQYLHRRAVAPEIEKAYNYVNKNINPPYALVVSDPRVKYLETVKSKRVYSFDPFNEKDEFYNVTTINKLDMTGNSTLRLDEMLAQNEKIVFIVPEVHMINKNFFTFLYENTTNVASDANISMYDYNSFYNSKQLYWPNIFVYDGAHSKT